jgi:tetratricopeptide (TPR) repeat protein
VTDASPAGMGPADEIIERLIRVRNLDELSRELRQWLDVDGPTLLAAVEDRARRSAATGLAHEAELLRFLLPHIEAGLPGWAGSRGAGVIPVEDRVIGAAALPGPLAQFRYLRRDPVIRHPDACALARTLMSAPDTPPPERDRFAMVYAVLGRWATEEYDRVQSRLAWASVLRRRGNLARAMFHTRRAAMDATGDLDLSVRRALAALYRESGDLSASVATLTAALETALATDPVTASGRVLAEVTALRRSLAEVLRELGRSREAIGHVNAALDLMLDVPELGELSIALIILRGLLNEDDGDYDAGAADFRLAASYAVRVGDREQEFRAGTHHAMSLWKAGRTQAGRQAFHRLLATVRAWQADDAEAATRNNLGNLELDAGDLSAAGEHFGAALVLRSAHDYGFGVVTSMFGLGDVLAREGATDPARTMYRMALVTAQLGGAGAEAAAMFAGRASEGSDDVEIEIEDVLRRILADDHARQRWWQVYQTSVALAQYLARRGRTAEAMVILEDLLGEAERRSVAPYRIQVLIVYARLCAATPGRRQAAFDTLWQARSAVLERVAGTVDAGRHAEIVAEFIGVYENIIDLLLTRGDALRLPGGAAPDELAYDLHEEVKSRTFLTRLADEPRPAPAVLPADLARRESDLVGRRRQLRHGIGGLTGDARERRLAELADLNTELTEVYAEVGEYAPEYMRMRQGRPASLREARELLDRHAPAEGMAIVSYFCGDRTTTCFTLTSGDGALSVYRIPIESARLASIAGRLRTTFNGDPGAFPPSAPIHPRRPQRRSLAFLDEPGRRLLPFAEELGDRALICVIPHGPLHLLPFHAFHDGTGTPLGARAAVTYAPSLSLLAHLLARPPRPTVRALVAGVAAREDPEPDSFEHDARILGDAGWEVDELSGRSATRAATLASLSRADVAHVTCHGYVDPRNPPESGLLLADDSDRPTKFVGKMSIYQRRRVLLRAADLAGQQISVRLLTLRACSGGWQSADNAGDEATGIARAMLEAGAAATVSALWNVDQRSSAVLLRELYSRWRAGAPLWRAMWDAQQSVQSDADQPWHNHEYHWASLILVGDWR